MLLRVTERIAFFLYDKKIIQKEDIRWCVYLFQKWILNTVSYTILYFIGCYIATPVQVILYLLNFEVLRRKSGGYHAKTPFRCILLSTSIEIVGFYFIQIAKQFTSVIFIWTAFSFFVLWGICSKKCEDDKKELRGIILFEIIINILTMIILGNKSEQLLYLYHWDLGAIVTASAYLGKKWSERLC